MKTHFGLTFVRGALVVGLAIGLTACSNGGSGSSSSETANTGGGTLTLIQNTPPSSLDPAKSNNGLASMWATVAYSNLLHWDANGEFQPELAASFQFLNDDNTEFELVLKPDIKFSDGTALNSAAVKTYLEYFMNDANGPFAANAQAIVKSIDTPDELTVHITFSVATPDAASYFAEGGTWGNIISPKALENPDTLGTTTDGAGPYMLDTGNTTSGSVYTYVKNPNFGGDASEQKWDTVVLKVIENTDSALQAVQTTKNSWTTATWQQKSAAESAGLQFVSSDMGGNVYSLFLSDRAGNVQEALGNLQVRQALNYAVDRESIAKLLNGVANEQIVPAGIDGYYDSSVYTYDPEKAKDLLAQAGYADGFQFTSLIQSFDSNIVQAAQILASNFQAIGVTMTLVTASTFEDFIQKQGSLQYSSDVEPWGGTTFHTIAQQLVLTSGVVNIFGDSDPEMEALFSKASAEPEATAKADWEALSKMVAEKAWYVPMVTIQQPYVATEGLNALGGTSLVAPNPLYM